MLNKIYGILNNIIIRLVVYYFAWLLALGGIFHLFPQILIYVSQERERVQGRERLFEGEQGDLEKIKEGVATLVEGNLTEVLLMVTFVDPARTIPVMVALAMAFWRSRLRGYIVGRDRARNTVNPLHTLCSLYLLPYR